MQIPFEKDFRIQYFSLLNDIFDSGFWSEGKKNKEFESKFSDFVNIESRSVSSGGSALYAILKYINVEGYDVIVPTNTFIADARAVRLAGGNVVYADCNREDLCLSFEDMKSKVTAKTKAVILVHIGGHIAFETHEIAEYCDSHNIYLIEDCAHAHGANWEGKAPGQFGFAGAYSFYATKTMPLGEGGMVVSKDDKFIQWLDMYRNYGKKVDNGHVKYELLDGFNLRMNEFTAALGIIQLDRLPIILEWKRKLASKYDQIFDKHIKFPDGMVSGYYKYIVFDTNIAEETGKVFGLTDLGHHIDGLENMKLPNSEWVSNHHKCVPIYYGYEHYNDDINQLSNALIRR